MQDGFSQPAQPGTPQTPQPATAQPQPGLADPRDHADPLDGDRRRTARPVDLIEQALQQLRGGDDRRTAPQTDLAPPHGLTPEPSLAPPVALADPPTATAGTAILGPPMTPPVIEDSAALVNPPTLQAPPRAAVPQVGPPDGTAPELPAPHLASPQLASSPVTVPETSPEPETSPKHEGTNGLQSTDGLEKIVASLHLLLVAREFQDRLPELAVGRPFIEGLAAILGIAEPGDDEPRFVTTDELRGWGLTAEMAYDLAARQTRARLEADTKRVPIGATTAMVSESALPIGASAMLFLDDLMPGVTAEGTLIAIAGPHVLLAIPGGAGEPDLVEAAVDFLRQEAASLPTLLNPSLLMRRDHAWEAVGDLTSAAGRFGLRNLVRSAEGAMQAPPVAQPAVAPTAPASPRESAAAAEASPPAIW